MPFESHVLGMWLDGCICECVYVCVLYMAVCLAWQAFMCVCVCALDGCESLCM